MFTREEAEEVLTKALSGLDSVRMYYRKLGVPDCDTLGKAIYCHLPDWLAQVIDRTDKDMFFEKSDDKAIEMLMALVDED